MFAKFLEAKQTQRAELLTQLQQLDMEIAAASAIAVELQDTLTAIESLVNRADSLILGDVKSAIRDKCVELGIFGETLHHCTPQDNAGVIIEAPTKSEAISPLENIAPAEDTQASESVEAQQEDKPKKTRKRRTKAEIAAEQAASNTTNSDPFEQWRSRLSTITTVEDIHGILDEIQDYSTEHRVDVPEDLIKQIDSLWENVQGEQVKSEIQNLQAEYDAQEIESEPQAIAPQQSEISWDADIVEEEPNTADLQSFSSDSEMYQGWISALQQPAISEEALRDLDAEIRAYYSDLGQAIPEELDGEFTTAWDRVVGKDEQESELYPVSLTDDLNALPVYEGEVPEEEELTPSTIQAIAPTESTEISEETIIPYSKEEETRLNVEWEAIASIVTTPAELADLWETIRQSGYTPQMPLIRKLDALKAKFESDSQPVVQPAESNAPTEMASTAQQNGFKPKGLWGITIPVSRSVTSVATDDAAAEEAAASILPDPNWQNPTPQPTPAPAQEVSPTPAPQSEPVAQPQKRSLSSLWSQPIASSKSQVASDDAEPVEETDYSDAPDLSKMTIQEFALWRKAQPVEFKCGSKVVPEDRAQILPVGTPMYHPNQNMLFRMTTWEIASSKNRQVRSDFDRVPGVHDDGSGIEFYTSIDPANLEIWTEEQAQEYLKREREKVQAIALGADPFSMV